MVVSIAMMSVSDLVQCDSKAKAVKSDGSLEQYEGEARVTSRTHIPTSQADRLHQNP